MKRFKNTYMFISAIKSGLTSLKPTPLQPQRCNIDLCGLRRCCACRNEAFLLLVHIFSEAHCSVFGRPGFSLGYWILVRELPLALGFVCFFFLFILMPTVMSPLYYRHVLNSLHLFFVFVFYFKFFSCLFLKTSKRKKEIRWLPHVCPPPANVKFPEQTGCHFTTSATFSALLFCLSVLGAIWNRRAGVEITSEHLWVIPEWDILHC